MSEDVLGKAKAKRESLAEQISQRKAQILDIQAMVARFEREAAELDAWIAMWHKITDTPTNPQPAERIENSAGVAKIQRPKNPDRNFVVDQTLALIEEAGRPLPRREVFEGLATKGIEINGKDPEMVLSTMLWRSPEKIVRLHGYGYWPKEIDFAPANYFAVLDELLGVAASEPEDGQEEEYEN